MRQGRDCSILKENGVNVAYNLGADFCAEHEWGIKGIRSKFGINPTEEKDIDHRWYEKVKNLFLRGTTKPVLGIEKRLVTKGSENLAKIEFEISATDYSVPAAKREPSKKQKLYALVVKRLWDQTLKYDHYFNQILWKKDSEIYGFWDENQFLLILKEEKLIDELFDAFKKNDVAIWLGGGGAFQNAGLVIAIKSKLPDKIIQEMYDVDADHHDLRCEAAKTGIYETLESAGKKYYALSPKWKNKGTRELMFWLNPCDQQDNNYGWFSLKDLEDWANDKGPIPMKKQKA